LSEAQRLRIAPTIEKSLERREEMEQTLVDFRAKHELVCSQGTHRRDEER